MGSIDAGSMCCCGDETFTVFGPRYNGRNWDGYGGTGIESVTMTYSFIRGLAPYGTSGATMAPWALMGLISGISTIDFWNDIQVAANWWSYEFDKLFPFLQLNLSNLGAETGFHHTVSDIEDLPQGVGDIRFGVHPMGAIAHAYYTTRDEELGKTGSVQKDVHFNPFYAYRLDGKPAPTTGLAWETPDQETGEPEGSLQALKHSGWVCPHCTDEELEHLQSIGAFDTDRDEGDSPFTSGVNVAVVALHELGHVLGLPHASNTSSFMYAKIDPHRNASMPASLDSVTKDLIKAIYDVGTVGACTGAKGIKEICEITVQGDDLTQEQAEDRVKSPVHLLGTVYYDEGNLLNTATTIGKYTITDGLTESLKNWSPEGVDLSWGAASTTYDPIVRHTVTSWGGDTLYSVSETTGAVQKADLSEAVAKWWYSPESNKWTNDSGGSTGSVVVSNRRFFPYSKFIDPGRQIGRLGIPTTAYHSNTISTHGHDAAGHPNQPIGGGWEELGLNLPTGPGWDSECGSELCVGEEGAPSTCLENPRGEFVRYIENSGMTRFFHQSDVDFSWGPWPWGGSGRGENSVGFSDTGFGAACPYTVAAESVVDKRKRGGNVVSEPALPLRTLSSVKVDSEGEGTSASPGDEVQWGWPPTACATNCAALSEGDRVEVMTDLAFCATGSNSKVIPVKAAANNWPNGAGGYAEVDLADLSNGTETNVLALLSWGELRDMVGDATMPIDEFWTHKPPDRDVGGADGSEYIPKEEEKYPIPIWPLRITLHNNTEVVMRENSFGEEVPCEITKEVKILDTHEEAAKKFLAAWDAKSRCADHDGNSVTKGDEGSSFTTFAASDIANYTRLFDRHFQAMVEEGELVEVYGDFDAENPGGVPVGFWNIKRVVGVRGFTYKSKLATGEIKVEQGKMPYIAKGGIKSLFNSDFYWGAPGNQLPTYVWLTKDKLESNKCGDYPWSYTIDFVDNDKKELAYMTRVGVTKVVTQDGWLAPHSGGNPLKEEDEKYYKTLSGEMMGCRTHVMKGSLYYYNETKGGHSVYVASLESVWEGLEEPYFVDKFSGSGRDDYSVDSDYEPPEVTKETYKVGDRAVTDNHCIEAGDIIPFGISGGSDFSGGSVEYRLLPNDVDTPNVETKQGGYYNLGRWDAGDQGATLGNLGYQKSTSHGYNNMSDFHINKGAHYTHSRLEFGGNTIWDEFDTENGFTQTKLDGPLLNKHKVDGDGAEDFGTARAKRLSFPRTLLDRVEVLVDDRIAVFTTEVPSRFQKGKGQTLSVFDKDGNKVWSVTSPQSLDKNAVVVASSDRWIHVIGFPLDVKEHTGSEVPAEGQTIQHASHKNLKEEFFSSWLFSHDGSIKVPARLDERDRVVAIDDYTDLSTASWADLRKKITGVELFRNKNNYDSPRKSSVIDEVKPGTMHPDEFF